MIQSKQAQEFNKYSEKEQELAQNALIEFKKNNFVASSQYLNKIENRNNDFKVIHNKAVVEYCRSDYKKIEVFQKVLTTICNQFRIKVENLDVEQCEILYNQAILLYHQKQYANAISIMEKVYKFIEAMDDTFAKKVSLFAIELQLAVRQPENAFNLINYLENYLINGTPNIKILDKKIKDKKPLITYKEGEDFKKRLIKYKARCYLLNHKLEAAKKEIGILMKENKNEKINSMFLSANLEYLKGNFIEAQNLLTSIPADSLTYNECGESSTIMFYNNMGVIHHAMGKPNMAVYYFKAALKEDIALNKIVSNRNQGEKQLYLLGSSKYHELMYNSGIALLFAKKPTQAFECLIAAVRRYHRNCRLWLRIAECCIMVHKSSNNCNFQKDFRPIILGFKDRTKLLLAHDIAEDKKYSSESQSYAIPVPSLEFATLCLRNADLLLPKEPDSSADLHFFTPGITQTSSLNPGPTPSSPLQVNDVVRLRNSILIANAYVTICIGDYILTLQYARSILAQKCISGVHKLLAHMYAAEALILLDNLTEALEHLNPENIKNISLDFEDTSELEIRTSPPIKWFPDTLASAHSTLQYNIAVTKTLRGQLEEALLLLRQFFKFDLNKSKVPGNIIMLLLYIELKLGRIDSAKSIVMQNIH